MSPKELSRYARMIVCAMLYKEKNVDKCDDCKYLKVCLNETNQAIKNVLQYRKENEWRKHLKSDNKFTLFHKKSPASTDGEMNCLK